MLTRREALRGAVAAATVIGFSPEARAWIGHKPRSPVDQIPPLDGELVTDPASLSAAAVDAGYAISRTPLAVLRPGSVQDIQKMVKFCRKHRIEVAARGQGHTTFGQALVKGGLIIEMSSLSAIHSDTAERAVVDAGVKWTDLVTQAVGFGLTPPVLTGYIGLSVGGTLSVGGISVTYNSGAQIDNVWELEVVNGLGELITCSPTRNRDLFEGVLGGLGQYGIITKATVKLVPAPEFVRVYTIDYADSKPFFKDFRKIIHRQELDDAYNYGLPDGTHTTGGWIYQLNLGAHFNAANPPNDAHLLRGLTVPPSAAVAQDVPYLAYTMRVNQGIDFLRSIGMWDNVMHPWFDVFLPDETVEPYVRSVTASLTPEDVGETGFLLLFAQRRSKAKMPMLRKPIGKSDWFFLFDILTSASAPGFDADFDRRMRARNRRLFQKARLLGGMRYPIGTLDFNKLDWIHHYGERLPKILLLKARHDPSRILTPGPDIF